MLIACPYVAIADSENIRFQKITLEQGLSQEFVTSAFQDSEGYMWFGTQEGLNRYDGYQFKVFTYSNRNTDSLSSDWIYSIHEMNSDQLWIGTSSGVNVFDKNNQSFRHLKNVPNDPQSLSNDEAKHLLKTRSGDMFVGTNAGLNRYLPATNNFERIKLLPEVDAVERIQNMHEDANGVLWVALAGGHIVGYHLEHGEILLTNEDFQRNSGISLTGTIKLMVDSQQKMWIGSDEGITVVDMASLLTPQGAANIWQPNDFNGIEILDVYEDRTERIWVATDNGLYRYNAPDNSFLHLVHDKQDPFSLSSQKLTFLFQDRGNVFWVGSNSGLNKWNTATANFDHLRVTADPQKSLSGSYSTAFHDGKDGFVWLASRDGLDRLNTQTGKVESLEVATIYEKSLLSKRVTTLYSENEQFLWIGYRDKGMSKYNLDNKTFVHYEFDKSVDGGIGAPGITTIQPAGNNKLWIGTFGGGLNLFDIETETFTYYKSDPDNKQTLSDNRVLAVKTMSNGLIWIGTWGGGLNIFNPTTGTAMRIPSGEGPKSLSTDFILTLHEDDSENVWIGTRGAGLVKISSENRKAGIFEFERLSRYDGLPSNTVFGVLEDDNGFLWLSTNRGITKFNPDTKELLNYDSSHGLQGNEFNQGAFYKSRDGKLYFGGTNGVTAFYPSKIAPNQHVPPVVLTKFQKLNEVYALDSTGGQKNNIQISHKDYLIAFEFAGLDFASPSNNRYLYKLEGFDSDWIEAGDIRKATYTNLPAGNYLFRVKASNNDGVWNEQGADVALTVLPAPWYSWWAYTIYTLFALGLIYWIYRSYIHKLEKEANYRHELELEVKNRTVELREANEQLLNASVTDQLTGLHNRRYLNNIVEQQCASVFRDFEAQLKNGELGADSGPRLFFLMFDLDGFKPINDTYGHDAGDKVICQVSDLLKTVCRKSDTVIRWGGDEFLVMGRVEEVQEIELLAERLRSKIASYGFDIDLKQKMHLSCSIGYSMYPFSHHYPDSLSWEQVHLLADNALYKSKEAGRNQWTGILQSLEMPPVSIMNTLTRNIDNVIAEGYVRVKQADRVQAPKVLNIKSRRR
ncbi:hypothetical protein GCM10009114_26170 [Aliiglaciecola litoralis]|uniref:GGDEF domain-containing protein n=1 Tax=Aliiglaciecola litoralis TaxID=582857 RepID=A0ABP3WY34_9ALTE